MTSPVAIINCRFLSKFRSDSPSSVEVYDWASIGFEWVLFFLNRKRKLVTSLTASERLRSRSAVIQRFHLRCSSSGMFICLWIEGWRLEWWLLLWCRSGVCFISGSATDRLFVAASQWHEAPVAAFRNPKYCIPFKLGATGRKKKQQPTDTFTSLYLHWKKNQLQNVRDWRFIVMKSGFLSFWLIFFVIWISHFPSSMFLNETWALFCCCIVEAAQSVLL